MNKSDHKKNQKGKTISPKFFAPNNNSNNPEVIVRPAFDQFHPESVHINLCQNNRALGWFPALRMGVVRI